MTSLRSLLVLSLLAAACGGSKKDIDAAPTIDAPIHTIDAATPDAGPACMPSGDMVTNPTCPAAGATNSNIKHLVVIVQENHTFDNYFGTYCTAATGSNPTCNTGPACCEKGPAMVSATAPVVLDDTTNGGYDPNHYADCESEEMNNGAMDKFVAGGSCSDPRNFAYAAATGPIAPYIAYAQQYAIADRYFQPVVGASSANDMYFARARYVFKDNTKGTTGIGSTCGFGTASPMDYTDKTIADLLVGCGLGWSWYAEGYGAMVTSQSATPPTCPPVPPGCPVAFDAYPCIYDATDVPFEYYPSLQDKPQFFKDLSQFSTEVSGGTLPPVSFVKPIGWKTEHPGTLNKISDGVDAVSTIVGAITGSATYASDTLILLVYDESGGYYDHVSPPPTSAVDCQPYGPRTLFMALGNFAKTNYVSHVVMEHSSIVKFIEWNWFGGTTGELGNRDTTVNNIGDLLDPAKTGTTVPAN